MATQLTAEDAKQSLTAHVTAKGIEVFLKYGPQLGWAELQRLLADRAYVRYPCTIAFDAAPLQPGEFAHPAPLGERPEDGYTMCVHPVFMRELELVPYAVLYQLVALNYGEFASFEDAENFGAAALGLTRDEYYTVLCAMSDRVGGGGDESEPGQHARFGSDGAGGGCSCGEH